VQGLCKLDKALIVLVLASVVVVVPAMMMMRGWLRKPRAGDPHDAVNYRFYTNKIPSSPDGDYIDNIHKNWKGDYSLLEVHHGYIQWLFPLFEGGGMNSFSTELDKREAALMRQDLEVARRVVLSYRLMLDFYGLMLTDDKTGEVARADNWKERFRHLNSSSHNYLRISRILQSLGHLGFSRYKRPLIDLLQKETTDNDNIPNAHYSLTRFWKPLLDVDSMQYIKKTLETEEDRVDSVFFKTDES